MLYSFYRVKHCMMVKPDNADGGETRNVGDELGQSPEQRSAKLRVAARLQLRHLHTQHQHRDCEGKNAVTE